MVNILFMSEEKPWLLEEVVDDESVYTVTKDGAEFVLEWVRQQVSQWEEADYPDVYPIETDVSFVLGFLLADYYVLRGWDINGE
jgi:hypothetical protein